MPLQSLSTSFDMRLSDLRSVVFLIHLWLSYSIASLTNVTVDDTGSGIQYTPPDQWEVGNNCTGCTARPDVTKASGGTWHDSTHQPDSDDVSFASLQFTGSAVYVFCIIARSSVGPDGNSDMSFFIDGQQVGSFLRAPTGENVYDYNVPVYANSSIPSGTHTIVIQNGSKGGAKSLILLDSIVFSTGEPDPTPTSSSQPPPQESAGPSQSSQEPASSSSNVASTTSNTSSAGPKVIIAAVVPSVVALLLGLGALLFFCTRRRRRSRSSDAPAPEDVKDADASGWAYNTLSPRGHGGDMQTLMSPSSLNAVSTTLFSAGDALGDADSVGRTPTSKHTVASPLSPKSGYTLSYQERPPASPYGDVGPTPLSAVTEEWRLLSVSRDPSGTASGSNPYTSATVPLMSGREASMTPTTLASSRLLPTSSSFSRSTGVRRTNTLISSDIPPAYESISHDDTFGL